MLTPMRQAIARHMSYSKQHIPHYYLTMRAEMSAALNEREIRNAEVSADEKISINDLMVKAVALALVDNPVFNGYYRDDEFHPEARINIGVGIALPDGLVAPAILDCGARSLREIAEHSRDLALRARQGKLRAEEYTTATFTVTNLGMYHIESFTAIIVPPQVGILAVGGVHDVLVQQEGDLITEHRCALTLSADHRATDGVEGARFLGDIISCLENPVKLFA